MVVEQGLAVEWWVVVEELLWLLNSELVADWWVVVVERWVVVVEQLAGYEMVGCGC